VTRLPYVSQLFIYPIKSARGIAVKELPVDVSGPIRDRRWMLVDEGGHCLTQRQLPRMALIAPRFEGDDLIVEGPGMPPLRIERRLSVGEWLDVRLFFEEPLRLPHLDPSYSEWFSSFLGQACRLMHLPDDVVRPMEPPFDRPPWRMSLADSFPLLAISQAALDLLNSKLPEPVTMARFRPNIVIAESEPHEEDRWRRIRAGEVELALVKLCARCAIPQVDPATGATGLEPLQTLAKYRRPDKKVLFGHKGLVTAPGTLRVGDNIEVLERITAAVPAADFMLQA
jgi:MOSC domain-containing protein